MFYFGETWLEDNKNKIRFSEIEGRRWYVAGDVVKALGCKNPSKTAKRMMVRDDVWFLGHTNSINVVDERGIIRSSLAVDEEGVWLFVSRVQRAMDREHLLWLGS